MGPIKVVFDVVNSVKGGSGKSTVSLLLASCLASRSDTAAYIIDLDLRGTSWVNNYGQYLKREDGEPIVVGGNYSEPKLVFINDLMNDFGTYKSQGFFVKLTTKYDNSVAGSHAPEEPGTVYLCIAKPSASEDIDDLKTDLFENAVFHIIDQIYEKHCQSDSEIKEIHVILDMPPSYERHAERILRRLLPDVESQLYKKVNNADIEGKFAIFNSYVVNLYMISALSPAHIKLNIGYIKNLFNKQVYSSGLNELVRDSRFFVHFIGNDTTNAIYDLQLPNSGRQASDALAKYIKEDFTSNDLSGYDSSMYGDAFIDVLSSFPIVGHMPFLYNRDFFTNPRTPEVGEVLLIPARAYGDIGGIIQKKHK